jgi:hypothetical protein
MLQIRSRRLLRATVAAVAALALSAGPAAADPQSDNEEASASSAHGIQQADDHRPAGAGTGRRLG